MLSEYWSAPEGHFELSHKVMLGHVPQEKEVCGQYMCSSHRCRQIFTLYTTWIFYGAVWFCNFPDVRGSLSRRPFSYCSVCMPFVIWIVHWLHTDSDTVLLLCVQQQNIAHSPPDSFGME